MSLVEPKARVVVFLPTAVIQRCAALATRYRASRSEILRIAIERGLKDVRPVLRRLERQRPESYQATRGGGSTSSGRARRSTPSPPEPVRIYDQLLRYGQSLLAVSPGCDREDARVPLEAQAKVLGADPAALPDLLDDVLSQLFSEERSTAAVQEGDAGVLPPD